MSDNSNPEKAVSVTVIQAKREELLRQKLDILASPMFADLSAIEGALQILDQLENEAGEQSPTSD